MLLGTYNHQIDQKNRFRIPAKFKTSLGDNIIITKGTDNCLFLFAPTDIESAVFEKAKNISMFDEVAQSPYFQYTDMATGIAHEVWFEDAKSVSATMALIDEFSLRGFFVWNIMRFFPSLWLVANSSFELKRYYQ